MDYENPCILVLFWIKCLGLKYVASLQHLKKICFDYNNSFLGVDDHKEVRLNGETLTFTLQIIKF